MSNKKKKKKEKIIYIDDGSTIADMSGVSGGSKRGARGSLKEQRQTFFKAMRMMFVPMLIVLGAICAVFLLMYLSMQ